MFEQLLLKAFQEIERLEFALDAHEVLRTAVAPISSIKPEYSPIDAYFGSPIVSRTHDHRSTILQLYATYEKFVSEALAEYIQFLAAKRAYGDLPENLRDAHRVGFLYVLANQDRFPDLNEDDFVSSYSACLKNEPAYRVRTESVLFHDKNLRFEILCELGKKCGLENTSNWLKKSPLLTEDVLEEPVDSWLRLFVSYRNDAAHGDIDDLLANEELRKYCEIVRLICRTFSELLLSSVIENSGGTVLGRVIKVLPEAGVALVDFGVVGRKVSVGQEVVFLTRDRAIPVKILSMQKEGVDLKEHLTALGPGVGIVFEPRISGKGVIVELT